MQKLCSCKSLNGAYKTSMTKKTNRTIFGDRIKDLKLISLPIIERALQINKKKNQQTNRRLSTGTCSSHTQIPVALTHNRCPASHFKGSIRIQTVSMMYFAYQIAQKPKGEWPLLFVKLSWVVGRNAEWSGKGDQHHPRVTRTRPLARIPIPLAVHGRPDTPAL